MNWYKRAQLQLIFRHEHEDSYAEQQDFVLGAYLAETNQPVGMIEYSLYEDEIYIKGMLVKEELRRNRIGTQMIEELKREYPASKMNWGIMTPEGSELYKSLNNPENTQEQNAFASPKNNWYKKAQINNPLTPEINDFIEESAIDHVEDKEKTIAYLYPENPNIDVQLDPQEWARRWKSSIIQFLKKYPNLTPQQEWDVIYSAFIGIDETDFQEGGDLALELHDRYLLPASLTYLKEKIDELV